VVGSFKQGDNSYAYVNGKKSHANARTRNGVGFNIAEQLVIGGRGPGDRGHNSGNIISDVRVYNRQLSDAEVKKLYKMGRRTKVIVKSSATKGTGPGSYHIQEMGKAVEGGRIRAWTDTNYQLFKIPKILTGATIYGGPHKAVEHMSRFEIFTKSAAMIYVAIEDSSRDGGLSQLLPAAGFTLSDQTMVWVNHGQSNGPKMKIYQLQTTGMKKIKIPPTQTKETVMSVMVKCDGVPA
jgi:hypothetical protein